MSFQDYLSSRFDHIEETNSIEEVKVNCFLCGDKKGHMYVNLMKGKAFCHRCGKSYGDLVGFISDRDMIPRREAVKVIKNYNIHLSVIGGPKLLDTDEPENGIAKPIVLPECKPITGSPESKVDKMALTYLNKRGFTLFDIKLYRLHYCVKGLFSGMIIVPVYERGALVYYSGRAFFPGKNPAKLFPDKADVPMGKSEVVFNLDIASDSDMIVITEGAFDAMKVGRSGVAIFGKKLSKIQRQKILATRPNEIVVMLDSDASDDTMETARELSQYHRDVSVVLLESGDPGSMTRKAIERVLDTRVHYDRRLQMRYNVRKKGTAK